MAEPSLTEIFGAGATQDANTITILKADLPGLTPTANNSAESLWVGIFLKGKSHLSAANYEANPDQSIVISTPTIGAQALTTRNNQQYRQYTENVNLYKLDNAATIDPDDF